MYRQCNNIIFSRIFLKVCIICSFYGIICRMQALGAKRLICSLNPWAVNGKLYFIWLTLITATLTYGHNDVLLFACQSVPFRENLNF